MELVSSANRGFCSGCGVCAGVCPTECLKMEFNTTGEYLPVVASDDCTQCGLCMRVCPFLDENLSEDDHGQSLFSAIEGIQHRVESGYYDECFVGYAPSRNIRWAGTSGGMVTWTLCELLRLGEIDHVAFVKQGQRSDKLFQFAIASTPEDVCAGSKSSYYPVESSGIVHHILEHPGRYAIVGLPCVCKAIRNAQRALPKLKERVRHVVGLVCAGQQVNARFSEAVANMAGLQGALANIWFREKKEGVPPANYNFRMESSTGDVAETTFFDGAKELWASGAFRLQGCNYCDDAFAECADIAFMDAWLPGYREESAGYNLILSRNPELTEIMREVETLELIGIDKVVQSQAVHAKRDSLRARLFIGRCLGRFTPRKRVQSGVPSVKILVKTALQWSQYQAARKNLAVGKPYNAVRVGSFPATAIQFAGSSFRRILNTIRK